MDTRSEEMPVQPDDSGETEELHIEYAGFWIRVLASILDTIVLGMVAIPLLFYFYDLGDLLTQESLGPAYYVINYALPFVAFIIFWRYRAATPGKIWMGIHIVDADTFGPPSMENLIIRYIGYYVSTFALLLGFIWIAFDRRKQGFHDKMANTVVIKDTSRIPAGYAGRHQPDAIPGHLSDDIEETDTTAPAEKRDPWTE